MKLTLSTISILVYVTFGLAFGQPAENRTLPDWLKSLSLSPLFEQFEVRPDRPRLYINPEDLPVIRERVKTTHQEAWQSLKNIAEFSRLQDRWYDTHSVYSGTNGNGAVRSNTLRDRLLVHAFSYLITGDAADARRAIETALELSADTSGDDLANAYRVWPESIAYDWCNDQLRPGEGQKLFANVRAQLKLVEAEAPLEKNALHMGHLVNYLADAFLPAGIAFYDLDPGIFERTIQVVRSELAAKNVFYRFGISSQGDSYGLTHYHGDLRMMVMLKKATNQDLFWKYPYYKQVAYYWVYTRRPDGQFLRMGDEWMDSQNVPVWAPPAPWGPPWLMEALAYAAGLFSDPYLTGEYIRVRNLNHTWIAITDIIWRDPRIYPLEPDSLPTVRYLDGAAGTLLFRTGWGPDDVVGLFKVMPLYVKNHDHLDRLSFQIYCRGALAIDSGIYEGVNSGYGSPHWLNYLQRTIAHNSLLIRDPNEEVLYRGKKVVADGGQRFPGVGNDPVSLADLRDPLWQVARVLSHREDRDWNHYAFVTADATPAYGPKAQKVQRSFVFLKDFDVHRLDGRPPKAAFVIYDRVVSRNPDHQKVWLFHSLEEPTIYGPTFSVQNSGANYGGSLLSFSLLPRRARIEKIGGQGKEFWVNDTNYATTKVGTCEAGVWRVEVTSQEPGKEVEFLHVFLVDPRPNGETGPEDAQLVEGRGAVGAEVLERTVVFSTADEPVRSLSYISNGKGDREHLVIGLLPRKMARVNINGEPYVRFETGEAGSMNFPVVQTGKAEFEIVVE